MKDGMSEKAQGRAVRRMWKALFDMERRQRPNEEFLKKNYRALAERYAQRHIAIFHCKVIAEARSHNTLMKTLREQYGSGFGYIYLAKL